MLARQADVRVRTEVRFTHACSVSQVQVPVSEQKETCCVACRPHARARTQHGRPTWAMDVSSCPYVICVPTRSTACVARAQGRQRRLCNPDPKSYMIRIPNPCAAHAQGSQCCRRRRTRTPLSYSAHSCSKRRASSAALPSLHCACVSAEPVTIELPPPCHALGALHCRTTFVFTLQHVTAAQYAPAAAAPALWHLEDGLRARLDEGKRGCAGRHVARQRRGVGRGLPVARRAKLDGLAASGALRTPWHNFGIGLCPNPKAVLQNLRPCQNPRAVSRPAAWRVLQELPSLLGSPGPCYSDTVSGPSAVTGALPHGAPALGGRLTASNMM